MLVSSAAQRAKNGWPWRKTSWTSPSSRLIVEAQLRNVAHPFEGARRGSNVRENPIALLRRHDGASARRPWSLIERRQHDWAPRRSRRSVISEGTRRLSPRSNNYRAFARP